MPTAPPITPAFAWALPDDDSPKKGNDYLKSLPNPLLKRSPPVLTQSHASNGNGFQFSNLMPAQNSTASGAQFPFSPMGNSTSLRQRRKPPETCMPPKHSLIEGYYPESTTSPSNKDETSLALVASSNGSSSDRDNWVLVYGFAPKTQLDEVMHRFDSFGHVIAQRGGQMNWVALCYESVLEAEKALCQHPCILSDGSVVGVCRIDKKLSNTLNFETSSMMLEGSADRVDQAFEVKNRLQETDVLVTATSKDRASKSNACERVLAFLFGWDHVI